MSAPLFPDIVRCPACRKDCLYYCTDGEDNAILSCGNCFFIAEPDDAVTSMTDLYERMEIWQKTDASYGALPVKLLHPQVVRNLVADKRAEIVETPNGPFLRALKHMAHA